MKKIDHVRKTVYIIVGILTIISLVFTLCKKVGLCASSDDSAIPFDSLPYLVGHGVGMDGRFSDSVLLNCVDYAISHSSAFYSPGDTVIVVPYNSGDNLAVLLPVGTPSITFGENFIVDYSRSFAFTSDGQYQSYVDNAQFNITVNLVYETINGNSYYKSAVSNYPVYVYNPENYVTNSGVQIFTDSLNNNDPPFSGHTKGGVLANYIDSDDLIEDSSDVPKVNTIPPADSSSISSWLQKILNGLAVVNGSIQSGVLTIGDYIGQGFSSVINWFIEPFDSDQFESELNDIALINDFSNLKTQVESCGIFDWSDVTPAQSLSFTFDFGGAVLPHTSCVVDFSWYTGTVKNICVAVICTFLVLGLLVTIINQLPNIIGGKSGDKGGGSDS